ncbi:hypothetical protein S245_056188 [Arachis hypogaea]
MINYLKKIVFLLLFAGMCMFVRNVVALLLSMHAYVIDSSLKIIVDNGDLLYFEMVVNSDCLTIFVHSMITWCIVFMIAHFKQCCVHNIFWNCIVYCVNII